MKKRQRTTTETESPRTTTRQEHRRASGQAAPKPASPPAQDLVSRCMGDLWPFLLAASKGARIADPDTDAIARQLRRAARVLTEAAGGLPAQRGEAPIA